MRLVLKVGMWGILGAALAAALIGGSFVLAGTSLTEPASAVRVVGPPLRADAPDRHESDATPAARTDPSDEPTMTDGPSTTPTAAVRSPTSAVPTSADDSGPERGDD
jgi:hypothetical protein